MRRKEGLGGKLVFSEDSVGGIVREMIEDVEEEVKGVMVVDEGEEVEEYEVVEEEY